MNCSPSMQIGKDRTGLLAAMVLTCCGASVDEIVTDYARSTPSLPSFTHSLQGLLLLTSSCTCGLPAILKAHDLQVAYMKPSSQHITAGAGMAWVTDMPGNCLIWGLCDACRSDDVGAVALGGMEKEELKGLDVSVFSRAPPQALLTTLEHLKCADPLDALFQKHAC